MDNLNRIQSNGGDIIEQRDTCSKYENPVWAWGADPTGVISMGRGRVLYRMVRKATDPLLELIDPIH